MTAELSEGSLTSETFQELLPLICGRETALNPDRWSRNNPLFGHCAVVSLVAQSLFGGRLLRASLLDYPEYAYMRSHYINELPGGEVKDFTEPQFEGRYPKNLQFEERSRSHVLRKPETALRFRLLSLRLAKAVTKNPLFDDPIYVRCFLHALMSPCQKMRFGAVMTRDNQIVAEATNDTIEELKALCEPTCIRFGITSRTESMLGACGHAEEWVMKVTRDKKIDLKECDLHIVGVKMNGFPWFKTKPEHTCLRCAVQMNFADLKSVQMPVVDRWIGITPAEALRTARLYATGEKKI